MSPIRGWYCPGIKAFLAKYSRTVNKMHDLVIANARIYDGEGNPPFKGNLGLKGEKITEISKSPLPGTEIIDAQGLCLAPGFIDVHGHSDFSIVAKGNCESRLFQGVTTEICGNCGFSAFPRGEFNEKYFQDEWAHYEIKEPEPWSDFEEYCAYLQSHAPGLNIVPLMGHGTLREAFNGVKREISSHSLQKMLECLKSAFRKGLFGLSTGLIYVPGTFARVEELQTLLRIVRDYDGIYTTHMRNEGPGLLDALDESISLAEATGVRLQISHLKTSGGPANWSKLERAIEKIETFKNKGGDAYCDRYPYIRSETTFSVLLPADFFASGHEIALVELKKSETRKTLKDWILDLHPEKDYFDRIFIGNIPSGRNKDYFGRSVSELAEMAGVDPFTFSFDLLTAENFKVDAFFQGMCEANMLSILEKPYTMVGSDSHLTSFNGPDSKRRSHPRAWGTFNRYFRLVLEKKVNIKIEDAISRVTGLPARHFAIPYRGIIKENYFADLVLFEPERLREDNDFVNTNRPGKGVELLLINGKKVLQSGKVLGVFPGRVLSRI
ncbi:amidohydrolase family protein [Candidatus Riflebacteria bacterium]